LQSQRGVDRKS